MKKVAIGLVAVMIAGVLLTGISGITGLSGGNSTSIGNVLSKDVYTFVCEVPAQQRPELIYFTCADGNNGIGKIRWQTWEASGASGVGEYFVNDCKPDCATGNFEFTNVNLEIKQPIEVEGKIHLTDLTYESIGADGISGEWNLAEFYLMMDQKK